MLWSGEYSNCPGILRRVEAQPEDEDVPRIGSDPFVAYFFWGAHTSLFYAKIAFEMPFGQSTFLSSHKGMTKNAF